MARLALFVVFIQPFAFSLICRHLSLELPITQSCSFRQSGDTFGFISAILFCASYLS